MSKVRVLLYAALLAASLTRRDEPSPVRDRFRDFEPLASSQVMEPAPLAYEGANYAASVGPEGLTFASKLVLGAYEVEQGGRRETLQAGRVSGEGFARARIERGPVAEEYVFENRRVEQLFRIAEPLGEGALTLRVSARSSFGGAVEEVSRREGGWKELWPFAQGIVFRDATGAAAAAYHGALVFDAAGRSMELDARWERGAIALEVPAEFMARASYPVTVDPWVEFSPGSSGPGGISNSATTSFAVSVATDTQGRPVVAWTEQDALFQSRLALRRWNGTAWEEMGAGSAGGSISLSDSAGAPSVAGGASDGPYLAWVDGISGLAQVYVKRWNGTAWVEMGTGSAGGGGVSASSSSASEPVLVSHASAGPCLAWTDASGGNQEIYVRRWNGTAWDEVGLNSASGGGISGSPAQSMQPSLSLDAAGNPVVAWADSSSGNFEIYVRAWNGSSWAELGADSAQNGGISGTAGPSLEPTVAIGPDGRPTVAWSEGSGAAAEIWVRRWNGSAWADMGAGSSQGGGVSADSSPSVSPKLVADAEGKPLLLWRQSGGAGSFFVRRWNGVAWVEWGLNSAQGPGVASGFDAALAISGSGEPILASSLAGEIQVRRGLQAAPASLKQFQLNGTTFIPAGGRSPAATLVPRATLQSEVDGYDVRLQIEARPLGTAFSGVPTAEGPLVSSGTEASCQLGPLANGGYHWQARLLDASGTPSAWIAFGGNPETEADFVIDVPDTAPQAINVESSSGNCGLLGVEVLLLLALLRRRRA